MSKILKLIVQKRLVANADQTPRICVRVKAVVPKPLENFLLGNFAEEVLAQKPDAQADMSEHALAQCQPPVRPHLQRFLANGEPVKLTVSCLVLGTTYCARSLREAVAFEAFARIAAAWLDVLCEHAAECLPETGNDVRHTPRPPRLVAVQKPAEA